MTDCPQLSESSEYLSDYVDGLLAPADESALAAHLGACESCRDLVDDLVRLKAAARALGPIVPPAHIWHNIQASLPPATRPARTQWMGLAAAIVLVTAGAYFFTRLASPPSPTPPAVAVNSNASAPATVETVEQELAQAAQHYETAIAQLEAVAKQDNNALPADAAAKLQVSLAQVDKFIAESRAALVSEPESDPARDSLFAALRKKVEILQQSVALTGSIERGETAARVMDGKKGL
jgi:anti-sigma factor RsiW